MLDPDKISTEAEAIAHIDRRLAERFPELYRIDPEGDSIVRIQHDPRLAWLFENKTSPKP